MRFLLPSLLLVAAKLVAANPISINPPPGAKLQPVDSRAVDSDKVIFGRMTNARRFAMGLPPLKPKGPRRGTRAASARRASTSMTPTTDNSRHCNILVKNANNPSITYGYATPSFPAYGVYGAVQGTQAGALEVSFNAPDAPVSAQLDFYAQNGPSQAYLYVGAVPGVFSTSEDLSPGSPNYAHLTATDHTAPGSPPVGGATSYSDITGITADHESAIWGYNAATQEITAQWINTDGSAPPTHIVFGSGAFYLTSDPSKFNRLFQWNLPTVTFTCVTPLTAAEGT
ncbi:hypothetical protein FRB90_006353 [Tulasnella sp. 427]|nr:hypothetical protein FRB90_006353 [Tulasnella sp. 427]